jgi:hypothetical protein
MVPTAVRADLTPFQQLQPGCAGVFHSGRSDLAPYEGYRFIGSYPGLKPGRDRVLAIRGARGSDVALKHSAAEIQKAMSDRLCALPAEKSIRARRV